MKRRPRYVLLLALGTVFVVLVGSGWLYSQYRREANSIPGLVRAISSEAQEQEVSFETVRAYKKLVRTLTEARAPLANPAQIVDTLGEDTPILCQAASDASRQQIKNDYIELARSCIQRKKYEVDALGILGQCPITLAGPDLIQVAMDQNRDLLVRRLAVRFVGLGLARDPAESSKYADQLKVVSQETSNVAVGAAVAMFQAGLSTREDALSLIDEIAARPGGDVISKDSIDMAKNLIAKWESE